MYVKQESRIQRMNSGFLLSTYYNLQSEHRRDGICRLAVHDIIKHLQFTAAICVEFNALSENHLTSCKENGSFKWKHFEKRFSFDDSVRIIRYKAMF